MFSILKKNCFFFFLQLASCTTWTIFEEKAFSQVMGSSYISFTPLHSVSTFPFSRFLICTFVEGLRVADLVFCNQGPKQLHLHSANFPTLQAAAACLLLAMAIGEDTWGIRNTVIHALDFHLK